MTAPHIDHTSLGETPTMPNQEIERKWLVDRLPDLIGIKGKEVVQGYMAILPDGTEIRVRQKGEKYFQTVKSGGGLVRGEIEIELSKDQYDSLWAATEGKRLEKVRYAIPHGEYVIELDVYRGSLEGLTVAEVEFKNPRDAATFVAPDWFGKDVTENSGFKNKNLAVKGRPQESA